MVKRGWRRRTIPALRITVTAASSRTAGHGTGTPSPHHTPDQLPKTIATLLAFWTGVVDPVSVCPSCEGQAASPE